MMCFFRRLQISHLADTGCEAGPGLKRHLASCSACREWLRIQEMIAVQLRKDAVAPAAGTERDLQDRIIRALPRQSGLRAPAGPILFPGLAWAAGFACVLALLATWIVAQGSLRSRTDRAVRQVENVSAALQVVAAMNPITLSTSVEAPFRNEMVLLSRDVERGLAFVSGCLPRVGNGFRLMSN